MGEQRQIDREIVKDIKKDIWMNRQRNRMKDRWIGRQRQRERDCLWRVREGEDIGWAVISQSFQMTLAYNFGDFN